MLVTGVFNAQLSYLIRMYDMLYDSVLMPTPYELYNEYTC
mgnify:FL=1